MSLILDGHKLAYHQDRVEAWKRGERIAPVTIDMALTRKCTYRCVYCYGQLQENRGDPLGKGEIFSFLDDAKEIGVKAVSFVSDGESTCNPFLYDAIEHGKGCGLDMALGTNGYLLNHEFYPDILPCLTYLRFNISAATEERYAYIHGCKVGALKRVLFKIREAVKYKREHNLSVTIGLQMVLMPDFADQILPLAKLGHELGVDYLVIKHCSDDEHGSLGVDYSRYQNLYDLLHEAERFSTPTYRVVVKWSKIGAGNHRNYQRCYGPPFILQLSGSGLVAPCGMLFGEKYSKYHIGNIGKQRFKSIWQSDRYWQVMDELASERFNAQTMCGCLCLQHKVNECLNDIKHGWVLSSDKDMVPEHVNFL